MAELSLPLPAIRRQLASAIHLLIQVSRHPDGSRKLTAITEITGMEGEVISTQDLFLRTQNGLHPTGLAAEFYKKSKASGGDPDFSVFATGLT